MNRIDSEDSKKDYCNWSIQVSEVGFLNLQSNEKGSKLLEFNNDIYAYNSSGFFKLISPALKVWQKIYLPISLIEPIIFNPLGDYLYFMSNSQLWKIKKCSDWITSWIKVISKND